MRTYAVYQTKVVYAGFNTAKMRRGQRVTEAETDLTFIRTGHTIEARTQKEATRKLKRMGFQRHIVAQAQAQG